MFTRASAVLILPSDQCIMSPHDTSSDRAYRWSREYLASALGEDFMADRELHLELEEIVRREAFDPLLPGGELDYVDFSFYDSDASDDEFDPVPAPEEDMFNDEGVPFVSPWLNYPEYFRRPADRSGDSPIYDFNDEESMFTPESADRSWDESSGGSEDSEPSLSPIPSPYETPVGSPTASEYYTPPISPRYFQEDNPGPNSPPRLEQLARAAVALVYSMYS